MSRWRSRKRVAIVGGGLAGMAAASVLCRHGFTVELFEQRRQLGGRAGSFLDPATGELVDHCQHVAMGCCTKFLDFCRRTQIAGLLRRHRRLHFFDRQGRRCDIAGWPLLPAPLHLAIPLLRFGHLSLGDRIGVMRAMRELARSPHDDSPDAPTIGQWLHDRRQSDVAIRRFWSVVLVSALGESLDNASLAAARKVFVDGFLSHPAAYHVSVPRVPLGELYSKHVAQWLKSHGVTIHLEQAVKQVSGDANAVTGIALCDGQERRFDFVILAVPWTKVRSVLPAEMAGSLREIDKLDQLHSSPITGVHLWFDRPITGLPHAVLLERLSQWVFNRGRRGSPGADDSAHYYQVVISASRELAGRTKDDVLDEVLDDLRATWPAARNARLLRRQIVTQREAVFSVRPGSDALRPEQKTRVPGLLLAGDWTCTGWPSTMEGAVRSGYLAAEAILVSAGRSTQILAPDLPPSLLARFVTRSR